ncbi:EAL domain-containing response regulator [Allochromatium palmeri]|uniref:EAL domain-containing protein n=1 Tax=Allochromatium palmeri TaxID=231048 RepID=A0A6N8EBC3_9GAMM|nr:EAL domain-containing protein [Allochromatium palmeri]MTW20871.1 EAL domain-containing protein [Allochromatium palmeri]
MSDHSTAGRVLLLLQDPEQADPLCLALAARGVRLETCSDLQRALAALHVRTPDLLVLSLASDTPPEAVAESIGRLRVNDSTQPRLVVLIPCEDIRLRLAAMRAGAELCLLQPAMIDELADRLARLLGARRQESDRVLVIDDQPVAALFASRVLQGAGITTECVNDPLRVMDALERFDPDLVLMDLHMPGASGIELTGILRGHERFADLPVIFLSSELDPDLQLRALRIGGDDFLSKPVAPSQLVASVRDRLQRVRDRQRRLYAPDAIDPLTRLVTREPFLKRLDWLIGQAYSAKLAADGASGQGDLSGQRAIVALELSGDDAALEVLAAEVAARLHPDDLAARIADRSVAILVWRVNHESIIQFAQDLLYRVNQALASTGPAVSVGGGWYPLTGACQDAVTLLSRAGKTARLSLQHNAGAATERRPEFDPGAESARRDHAILEAIESEWMQVLFEPMFTLTDLKGERYEMTPRARIGDGELLPPAEFVPLAIQAGLAARLNRWLLLAGLEVLVTRLHHNRPVQLFIHQALAGLDDDAWTDWLRDQINARDLIRLRPVIQFEINEADQHLELAIQRSRELAKLGIRLCLNGLDLSERSRRVLTALPMTYVRVSRSVIHGPDAHSISKLIKSVKGYGARVVATGVDGPATIARLFGAGVDLIQGPYVQPPTPEMDFEFCSQ